MGNINLGRELENLIYVTENEKRKDYHFTDMGNAERLVDLYGADFRYCYPFKKWFVWDGKRWKKDDTGAMRQMCKDMVRSLYREAGSMDDDKQRKALIDYARKCETVKRARDMLDFAQSETGIPVLPDQLDANIYLINCLNGTVDLKTGELWPHNKDDLLTKLAPAKYMPGAECSAWLAHLDKILDGDEELIRFLQKALGYSISGDTSERKIFIEHGSGANGKSITNDTVAETVGDYAMRTPTETLLIKRHEGIPNDIARLKGARFVYASEAEQGKRFAESLIKDLSGGDKLAARFLHQEYFEFHPEFKVWLGTNHKPNIRGTDKAIWDRIRLIPFTVRIPEDEQIPKQEILDTFRDEMDGIFTWLVEGCLAWQREGLGLPEKVAVATKAYQDEMDIIGGFLDDCCVMDEFKTVTVKHLFSAYEEWAEENGEKRISKKLFGMTLDERGIDMATIGNARTRLGIGLKEEG
jgi:putative DNA primase/helicase